MSVAVRKSGQWVGSYTVDDIEVIRTSVAALEAEPTANVFRIVHDGTSYPARPTDLNGAFVEWVGPTEPPGSVNGDTWVNTST